METTLVIEEQLLYRPWGGFVPGAVNDFACLSTLTTLDVGMPDFRINGGSVLLEWARILPMVNRLSCLKIRGVAWRLADSTDEDGLRITSERLGVAIRSLRSLKQLHVSSLDMHIPYFLNGCKGLPLLEVCDCLPLNRCPQYGCRRSNLAI